MKSKSMNDYIIPPFLILMGVAQLFATLALDFPDSLNTFQIFNGATAGILIGTGVYLSRLAKEVLNQRSSKDKDGNPYN